MPPTGAPRSIPAVEAALDAKLTQGNSTGAFPQPLLDALAQAYREAMGGTGDQA
jgi:hypothetical protein